MPPAWFDSGDYPGDLPTWSGSFMAGSVSAPAREAIAIAQVESIRRQGERQQGLTPGVNLSSKRSVLVAED